MENLGRKRSVPVEHHYNITLHVYQRSCNNQSTGNTVIPESLALCAVNFLLLLVRERDQCIHVLFERILWMYEYMSV